MTTPFKSRRTASPWNATPGALAKLNRPKEPTRPPAPAVPTDADLRGMLPLVGDASTALLTTGEVADMLRVTARCLERYRRTGEGPRFVRIAGNTVRYRAQDVAKFIAMRLRDNTAQ